ncbi:hypothetical protein ACFWY9_13245 [Amycolatopsis sp. NPDC059027]|uniref:hypothetical protein n=1 Tax=unclassified Amycolatopsis TaxID=2618356 RepID=UPI00366B67AE
MLKKSTMIAALVLTVMGGTTGTAGATSDSVPATSDVHRPFKIHAPHTGGWADGNVWWHYDARQGRSFVSLNNLNIHDTRCDAHSVTLWTSPPFSVANDQGCNTNMHVNNVQIPGVDPKTQTWVMVKLGRVNRNDEDWSAPTIVRR